MVVAYAAYAELLATFPDYWSPDTREARKEFAMKAAGNSLSWAMFAILDGRKITERLWKNAKPEAHWTPSGRVFTEDAA